MLFALPALKHGSHDVSSHVVAVFWPPTSPSSRQGSLMDSALERGCSKWEVGVRKCGRETGHGAQVMQSVA